MTVSVKKECWDLEILLPCVTWSQSSISILLRVRNPNLQVVITHASRVCDQHSFGFPLRMNGMHRTQFDHARFDLLPLVIWSLVFSPSVTCATCATHSVGAKAFGPSIVVARTPYPLVITSLFNLPLTHIKHLDQLIDKLLFGAGLI